MTIYGVNVGVLTQDFVGVALYSKIHIIVDMDLGTSNTTGFSNRLLF